MALVPFVILLAAHGRGYYMGPVYPMLFAAGAVALEQMLTASGGFVEEARVRSDRARFFCRKFCCFWNSPSG